MKPRLPIPSEAEAGCSFQLLNDLTAQVHGAIHVFVESEGALVQHPVLVTVRQPRGVRSWSIPYVDSGFAYRSVDRTLCPLLNIVDSGEPMIRVDLSTLSNTPLNITLRLTTVENYKIQLNTPVMLSASPSRPSYLLFDYPPGVTRVRVKFTSTDDTSGICAIASLQTAYCPEVELMNNREARGTYQTLRSIASINTAEYARGSNFGYFYVVLTVFPNNGREDNCDFTVCGFKEMVTLDNNTQNYNPMPSIGEERVKRVNITIEPALTDKRYYIVMGVTLGLFSLFYFITCTWIIVFDWWKYDTSPKYSILKRGQSVFLESNLENIGSPLKSGKPKLSQQFKFDSVEDNDERALPNEDKEDQSGSSVKGIRPTLLSVMIGVHWKHSIKKASKKSSTPTENKLPDPHHPSPTPLSEATPIPTPHSETTPSTTPHPETTPSTAPYSETTPSTAPYSETTSSKALVHQSSVPPDSSMVRHRHVTPLITEAVQKTEIDVGGGSDLGPSTADKHVQFSQAGTGGVREETSQSYKYDTSAFPVKVVLSELGEIDEYQKVFDLYPMFILVIAVFYSIPAVQLVLTYRWLTGTGNEDICYYNNLCSHPWETSGGLSFSSFNNIFSNVGYFALGLLLILIARRRRRMYDYYVNRNHTRAPKYRFGVPQQFGLFYAMGMSMMAQAVLSAAYHVCPTRDNFRFDSTFMYFIPTLGLIKLMQSRNPDKSPGKGSILILLSVIVVAVVVGMVSSDVYFFWPIVFIFQTIISLVMAVQLYYRFQMESRESLRKLFAMYWNEGIFPPRNKPKFVLAILTLILNWGFAIYALVLRPSKFGSYVLNVFLTNFGMYLIYYIATKRIFKEIKTLKVKTVAFSIAAVLCYTSGLYFYSREPTDWNLSPAVSRDKNLECVLFGFYDVHDIWHFLGGFGLFFSGLVLMTMDDKQEVWARRQLLVF